MREQTSRVPPPLGIGFAVHHSHRFPEKLYLPADETRGTELARSLPPHGVHDLPDPHGLRDDRQSEFVANSLEVFELRLEVEIGLLAGGLPLVNLLEGVLGLVAALG